MTTYCPHENTPTDPRLVVYTLHTDGRLVAQRQCRVCNATHQFVQPEPADMAGEGRIEIFFDWDQGIWEPLSKREAYEARQLEKVTPPSAEPAS